MGVHSLSVYILAGLCASLSKAAPVSESFVVLVLSPVSVHHGRTTTLPCWLNPPQNAEGLEVRWYRSENFDTPIILYQAQNLTASQDAQYNGRVSFGLKDATSGGLKTGDVSLSLGNVTVTDAGEYTCYISSDKGYDKASISLSVIGIGAQPFLSVDWRDRDEVNVSCESAGWYPKPQLRWFDQKQDLNPKHLDYSERSSGLMSVHSWLLVPSSSEVSCSVEGKVASVHLGSPPESAGSLAGWVAFAILLIVALAGLLYYKRKALFKRLKSKRIPAEEVDLTAPLLEVKPTTLAEATKHYVNVTFDSENRPYLTIRNCKVRDAGHSFPDGSNVTCLTAIRGKDGFSSGQHYWEVSLGKEDIHVGLKQSWWVGVTSATSFSEQPDIPPTASNGFWFLSSSPDRVESFQFSTEPKVLLPVVSRPQTLGVYLNYAGGELSFYNVDAKSLIGSLNVQFKGGVFPLFNPGNGDKAPMEILQKPVEGTHSDEVNSVQSTSAGPAS
ncbi:butyrophilin subfamily 1 member A1-like isoform X2 [Betta splendens]|uniref:Butyrophilin subfamily 1 member A1-like isoform X2 n=1 Tax=Betta splendens TaxID=158456 RepID=A0A9W2X9V5_BETSP|nr:butyrophilin subfamily 1 member A1-like isoform X2 [Betta splendens]